LVNATPIHLGLDDWSPYFAFGDDSHCGDIVVFAFVIIPRNQIEVLETKIDLLKQRFKIPKETTLHCRVLFNGHQREKAGLAHLKPAAVQTLISRLVTIMNQSSVHIRWAVQDFARFMQALGSEIELRDKTGESVTRLSVNHDPKGLIGMLMNVCFAVAEDGSQGPSASQCKIYVSEDATKCRFLGEDRRRADAQFNGFSDIGAPPGHVFRFHGTVAKAEAHAMFQLADVAAYVCSHAYDDRPERKFFREQISRFRNWRSFGPMI